MTTFDALGLPIFEITDKIAASGDGLREDLNLIGTSARNAITAEGARAEAAAKTYADTKAATNQSAWVAGDTATLASAKSYSDDQNQAYRVVDWAKFREEDATNLAAAKTYADSKDGTNLTAAKTYTDSVANAYRATDRALWRAEDDGHQAAAEANAKAYADGVDIANRSAWAAADAANLTAAKSYADAAVSPDRARLTNVETKNAQQDGRLVGLEAVAPKVSNIALDADGNPYFSPGSTQVHVIPDSDGEPYYITFLQASADTDGTPYF